VSVERFRQYLVGTTAAGAWRSWADFTDRGWYDLVRAEPPSALVRRARKSAERTFAEMWPGEAPCEKTLANLARSYIDDRLGVEDSLDAWRLAREKVLAELNALGLTATVERTDRAVPIEEHEADLAGLVRLHPPGWDTPVPRSDRDRTQQDYARRMTERHALIPHDGLPSSPREFCGQHAAYVYGGWLDHVRTWLGPDGYPVLTTEPYDHFDPAQVVRALGGVPLVLDVAPGVWHEATTLIMLRWDPDADVLPAINWRYRDVAPGFTERVVA
jgi:hypothetical protein